MPSEAAVQQVWTLSLVVYVVVVVVVAVMLTLILRTARQIHGGVKAIWNTGQQVANNTIHVALLLRTNHLVGRILESAKGTVGAAAALEAHASGCPHCPECVTQPGGRG